MTVETAIDLGKISIHQHQVSGLFITNFSPDIISKTNFTKCKLFENIYFYTDLEKTILTFPDKIHSPTVILPNHLTRPTFLTVKSIC